MTGEPHPDDFMVITIEIEFRAKEAPGADHPVAPCHIAFTLPAREAADEMDEIVAAIEEQRLYGWVAQRSASLPIGSGQWIEKTGQDSIDEYTAKQADNVIKLSGEKE